MSRNSSRLRFRQPQSAVCREQHTFGGIEFDGTKTDAGRGAYRLIPPEFCLVRLMQLGSAQSSAIRGSWFSLPMLSPSLRAGRIYCVG